MKAVMPKDGDWRIVFVNFAERRDTDVAWKEIKRAMREYPDSVLVLLHSKIHPGSDGYRLAIKAIKSQIEKIEAGAVEKVR